MANHASHAALPYPIKGARYTLLLPYLDADGDPTDPTTPDTEISKDDGAAADCAEEVSSPKNSVGMLTLTGAETSCSCASLAAKAASGPKTTLATIFPRVLALVASGTSLDAGSASGGTISSGDRPAYDVTGCFFVTTGGTGGGGTGGANNQGRKIATYVPSTGVFTVSPDFETAIDTTTDWEVRLPEGVTLGMLRALNPTTAGRTLDVSATGEAGIDLANVGSPTTDVNLSGTTIKTATDVEADTANIQTRVPTALNANGLMKSDVMESNEVAISLDTDLSSNVDSILTNTTTLLARIGAWTGTGVNTVLGAFKALLSKIASAPSDIGGTFDPTTDSTEAVRDNMGTAQTGDAFARLGGPAGASVSADVAAAKADTAAILVHPTRTVLRGTVGVATLPTVTQFTPSALDVAGIATDQLKGRIIIFDKATTTTALRGQATNITASGIATLPLLTFTALTTAPVSGDTFSIV